ncbi:MAG: restriction endonuclease subunit S [Balneolaceae bacterium]|nr:restriction endonuclease subunit S [Balneolaceae bacterium]
MNLTDLLQEFNVVIDTAEGLTELRSLILGLAVRGKLVPQDPNDEPASELLKKIKVEKQRLYEEDEIRKPKKVKQVSESDYPFEIPNNWVWTNLNEAGVINPRNDAKDDLDTSFISMSLISEGFMEMHDSETRKWKEIKSGYTHFAENDVGLAKITPCFQNGKAAIFRNLANGIGAGTTELYIFRSVIDGLIPEYVYAFLKTPDFVNQGVEEMTGTAGHQRVPKGYFEHRPFPLPPSNEQHRIVQKIESLFAEVDELEDKMDRQTNLDEKLQLAVNTEVQQAPDAEASKTAWNFITSNFETLYHTPEAIDNLKKNILNEAVRGRLVFQDPNDESAFELLKKIEAEKQRLFEEGEIRKPKDLPPVDEREIPFEVPESWTWTRLGNTANDVHYGYTESADFDISEPKFLRITDIQDGSVDWDNTPGCSIKEDEISKYELQSGDLIIARTGGTVGKSFLIYEVNYLAVFASYLIRFIPTFTNTSEYIYKYLNTNLYWNQLYESTSGTGQPNVNATKLSNLLFPLPPLEEQHRIVQRIEELFAICDRFKAQLEQRQQVNERLVKGLVGEVLEGS